MTDELNFENENAEFDAEFDAAFDEATGIESEQNEPEQQEIDQTVEEPEAKPEKSTDELIEELQRDRDNWRHQFQSNNGRISTYQKQIQDLQGQIQDLSKKQQDQLQQSIKDNDWDQIKEDFPELADAMDKRLKTQIDQALSRISQFDNRLKPIEEQTHQQRIQGQYAALAAEHPDYKEVVRSNEFQQWIQTQPQPVKQLYNSEAAQDAAYLLSSFKAMTGRNKPSQTQGIQENRRAKLAASASPTTKRVAKQPIADDDFDAAWEAATANL